ncbi:MAG: 4-hydroxythreonine-4-phosphate dehydrogenase PdxA [Zetaproteobacteria bacterium]|nr:4-hydroxythreonine-4-phosphate dehydrogenase PdxA [Zetaproteobacteria bacterium]
MIRPCKQKPLLITLGEPAGIGSDCVLLAQQDHPQWFANTIIAAPKPWLALRAKELGIAAHIESVDDLYGQASDGHTLLCWNPITDGSHHLHTNPSVQPIAGHPTPETAQSVIACIEAAALACIRGDAKGMTTGPIEKAVLRNAGFTFPGHTEFLAHLGNDCNIVMMLASQQLRIALLTTHLALQDVPAALSIEKTLQCIQITHHDLKYRFGIETPRLAMCGLNPHAGEQGHFGREELNILMPAVELARQQGIQITDPLPADTLFSAQMRQQFDTIVCCYHDQGLIPIKALSFGDAVNVTLGLPFIRTSVDHGTALDRAGKGNITYSSLVEAIKLAHNMQRYD